MNELVPITNSFDIMTLGDVLKRSGYFSDIREASQAIVKILAGQELGIGPVAAMTGIYIVKGRVTLSANLMAAQIKRSGRYDYRITRLDDNGCEIAFSQEGEAVGTSAFTEADAKAAGLLGGENWKKFPRNMYFARALSNGAKWYCPDLFAGPVYTPDELQTGGASYVDTATGEIIDATIEDVDTTPDLATDKQRNFIGVLQDKLGWTSEVMGIYAQEHDVDLAAVTKSQAGILIEGMQKILDTPKKPAKAPEKPAAPANGTPQPKSREDWASSLRAAWNEEKAYGGEIPALELAIDLDDPDEATIDVIKALGKQSKARLIELRKQHA